MYAKIAKEYINATHTLANLSFPLPEGFFCTLLCVKKKPGGKKPHPHLLGLLLGHLLLACFIHEKSTLQTNVMNENNFSV